MDLRIQNVRSKPDRMFRWIIGTACGLAILYLTIIFWARSAPQISEAPWFIPLVAICVALTGFSVAVLAFGRFQVQQDPLSFWVGMSFLSTMIGQFNSVLSWPGLLSDGRAILAMLPNTSAVVTEINLTLHIAFLLAAVLSERPIRRTNIHNLAVVVVWIICISVLFLFLFSAEDYLPVLVRPDGAYTILLYSWIAILFFLYAIGSILTTIHYRRSRDPLAGYIAFSLIVTVFIILMTLVSVRRYDLWWYSQRLVAVFGSFIVLFGLLSDYVSLFQEVRESEGRYRQLAESLPQLIWTCSPDGLCDYLSPQWVDYTGIPASEQLGIGWAAQIHPDDREVTFSVWQAAIRSGSPFEHDFRLRRSDGVYRWFTHRSHPIHDFDGRIIRWFGSSTDIQQQKTYAELLERNNRDLQEIGYFTSHGLQEPVRKIEMYADKLLDDVSGLERRPRDRLARLQKSAGRMRAMLAALFQLSRLTSDPLVLERVELTQVVNEVTAHLESQIRAAGGLISVGSLPAIQADRSQLYELFSQLIVNALKFQPEGAYPIIDIKAQASLPGQVQLTIKDNGIGFAEEWAGRIFEPFQRLVGQNEFDGSGIGLALCRKIVERHQGTISVSSKPGEGANFIINLPLKQDSREEIDDVR